jgi:hypothetical protein
MYVSLSFRYPDRMDHPLAIDADNMRSLSGQDLIPRRDSYPAAAHRLRAAARSSGKRVTMPGVADLSKVSLSGESSVSQSASRLGIAAPLCQRRLTFLVFSFWLAHRVCCAAG